MEKIRINFWVDESLYYAIKGKLLDHKRATRERITITDICTKALQDYIQRGETAQAVLEQAVKDYLNPKEGKEMKKWFVKMDDEFNSPIWWGEINLRTSKGDPFAKKLSEDFGVTGSKKEIMALVDYAKSIDGYYDGDERAPEALLYGEVSD